MSCGTGYICTRKERLGKRGAQGVSSWKREAMGAEQMISGWLAAYSLLPKAYLPYEVAVPERA